MGYSLSKLSCPLRLPASTTSPKTVRSAVGSDFAHHEAARGRGRLLTGSWRKGDGVFRRSTPDGWPIYIRSATIFSSSAISASGAVTFGEWLASIS
jgi:hypothetical protein